MASTVVVDIYHTGRRRAGPPQHAHQLPLVPGAAAVVRAGLGARLCAPHGARPPVPRAAKDGRGRPQGQPRELRRADGRVRRDLHRRPSGARHRLGRRRHLGEAERLDQRRRVCHHGGVHPPDGGHDRYEDEGPKGAQREGQREERAAHRRAAQLRDRQVLHQRGEGVRRLQGRDRGVPQRGLRMGQDEHGHQHRPAVHPLIRARVRDTPVRAGRRGGRDERRRRRPLRRHAQPARAAPQLLWQQLPHHTEGLCGHGEHL
mmetsp:Transcript_12241/g.29060  ORF Transcript_12241/g.29060 Transcript_12241/m.29060 type:complete len:260 (-) Transcript_12241:1029-1808(-)